MSNSDMKSISEQLAVIRALLERETGTASVTWARAAEMLSCSEKHLRRMAARGSLAVVSIEGLPRIPMSEIRRLTSVPEREGNSKTRVRTPPTARPKAPRASFSASEFDRAFSAKFGKPKKR